MNTQMWSDFSFLRDHLFCNKHEFHWHSLYTVWDQVNIYKSGYEQNWPHSYKRWCENRNRLLITKRVSAAQAVPLCWPLQLSLTKLLPLWSGGYLYHGAESCSVPWEKPHARTLPYATSFQGFPPKRLWTDNIIQCRAQASVLWVFCFIFKNHESFAQVYTWSPSTSLPEFSGEIQVYLVASHTLLKSSANPHIIQAPKGRSAGLSNSCRYLPMGGTPHS